MRKLKQFNCVYCGTSFKSGNKEPKFCSKKCSAIYNNKKRGKLSEEVKNKIRESLKRYNIENPKDKTELEIKCKNCGKKFIADKKNRKYCSNTCRYKARSYREKGELSVRTFQKILKRAFPDWECPFCEWNKTFQTHYVKSRKEGGTENTNNLVMLCPNHHTEIHLKDGDQNKTISDEDVKKYRIGKDYTGEELMEKFYYGDVAKEFKKNI